MGPSRGGVRIFTPRHVRRTASTTVVRALHPHARVPSATSVSGGPLPRRLLPLSIADALHVRLHAPKEQHPTGSPKVLDDPALQLAQYDELANPTKPGASVKQVCRGLAEVTTDSLRHDDGAHVLDPQHSCSKRRRTPDPIGDPRVHVLVRRRRFEYAVVHVRIRDAISPRHLHRFVLTTTPFRKNFSLF